ncbi:hypothetical protein PENPOL_c019G09179 [Penicillium polonicum]|uniref:Uncharacterized protein n=1 Tax=Penicillium polonicum TaxID=60169 RepID=A0A1V6N8G6_PENPO|nr:hypothetical protein PENPOL_c019G09179 [Penicillium polonicum]
MSTIRYSNTYELTKYYRSVFSKFSPVARQEMLKALERPTFSESKKQSAKPNKQSARLQKQSARLQKPEEDDVSKLVKSLRLEPSAYFGRVKKVEGLTQHELSLIEDMLSTRKMEKRSCTRVMQSSLA